VDLEAMQGLRLEDSLASLVVRSGEAIAVEDVAADPRAVDPSSIDGWPQLGPVMVVPLRSGRGVEGALSLGWTKANAEGFQRVAPALPTSFAEQATLALQVARSQVDRARLTVFEDRDRIGQDLHDLVIQRLFAVGLGLQSITNLTHEPQVAARLEQAIDDLDGTIKDIRRTIFSLGAIEAASDVQSEVERLVERAGATMKLRPRLTIDGPLRTAVAPVVVPDLLAVLGEALANAARHAGARPVEVQVRVDASCVSVTVADDGVGMDPEAPRSGLDNMRTRALKQGGDVVVESAPGAGTTVRWTVPCTPPAGGS
jgi:signal transduction histidine kinase